MPGDGAEAHRQAHEREPDEHPDRARVEQRAADPVDADAIQRHVGAGDRRDARRAQHAPAQRGAVPVATRQRRLERRHPASPRVGLQPGRAHAGAHGEPRHRALGLRHRPGLLVDLGDLRGDLRPGVALGARGGAGAELGRARRLVREPAQELGELLRVPAREEDAVDAVADHVAVARDVGGHDRGPGRERLGQDHAERLAAQGRRGQHVGGLEREALALVGDAAEHRDALALDQHRRDLGLARAHDREAHVLVLAQRLEGAQQDRQALALDGLADEDDLQRLPRKAQARERDARLRQRDAVGDDGVLAAVEAPPGPGGGLGDRDPAREVIEPAAGTQQRRDLVRRDALRVAVEGADERRGGGCERLPADHRRDRLVQVDDVEVARAQLAPQPRADREGRGAVRDGAVGRPADRGTERDQPLRLLQGMRVRATMAQHGRARVLVPGRQHPHLVAAGGELRREGLDVPVHTAGVAPRVRGDDRDPHLRAS